MLGADGKPVGSFEFRQAPLGAGGFVTGVDISTDGSRMIHWTDAWNGYIRDKGAGRWDLLLRADNMIRAEWSDFGRSPSHDNGVYAGRIAPSNKDVIYCAWHGFIYKTTDGGAHWARTAFAPKLMESNMGPQRRFTRVLDVHPTDPNTVILGTNGDGVYYTTSGGASWTAVSGLAAPAMTLGAPSKYLVAFDPGQPATVYIHVVGTGLYRSTSGVGGTFSLLPGSPLNASRLLVTAAGKVYIVKYREGGTSRLASFARDGSDWTTIGNNPNADQVAVNPLNLNHIVTVDEDGGTFRQSYDGGVTWVQAYVNGAANAWQWTRGDGETKWFSNRAKPMFPAMLLFDPVVNGKLWVAEGIGISWSMCPPEGIAPTNDNPWVWHDFSRGNEELIPNSIGSSPGNPVILACWDKPFWRMDDTRDWTNMWSYPVPAGGTFNEGTVTVGYCTDYAADDHKFLVGVVGQGGNQDGYSTDGGRTWTKFANPCAGFGGWVAVSTRLNFIRTATNNGPAQYTLDGGQTWKNVAFGGQDPVIGWANAYYVVRQNITADKTRPGVFAAILNNMHPTIPNTLGNPNGGVWLTKDGGQTWTHRHKGAVNAALGGGRQEQFWQGSLQYVPGKSGELLWADLAGSPDNRLGWSQDDGATWKQPHPAIRDVLGFGFGKALQGKDRPTVYLNCVIGGVRGIYASFDWFKTTPVLLVERPLGHIGGFGWTNGDLNVVGRCYVALSGHGFAVCDYRKRFALMPA